MTQAISLAFYIGKRKLNPQASVMDRLVCALTRSHYSHVELVYHIDKDTNTAQCWSSSPIDGGVRRATITLNHQHWELYTLLGTVEEEDLHTWFKAQDGKPYDWLGALGVKFKLFSQNNDRWFCSEIIASYLGMKRTHRLSPINLYQRLKPMLVPISLKRHSEPSSGS